ncbi:hypothetical protein [Mesorhizobium sp. M0435]|uniref:hypothetical protein n=1 Tax=Mesorhizobium sp. M0435 TaxID=2956944 RepID=UPI00333772D2
MKILDARPEPPGCGNVIARVDVALNDAVKIYNLKVSKRPDGGFAVFAPNAHGGRVVTFSRSLVAEIASAAVAALMEPTPNDGTHTEAETFLDLINNGDAERLASFHYGNMARTGGSIMVAPEDVAWDHYTFKRELLQPRSDNEPADISEALRWCVVVDNIPECDDIERETPLMRKFLGRLSAMSSNQVILKRDLGGLSL